MNKPLSFGGFVGAGVRFAALLVGFLMMVGVTTLTAQTSLPADVISSTTLQGSRNAVKPAPQSTTPTTVQWLTSAAAIQRLKAEVASLEAQAGSGNETLNSTTLSYFIGVTEQLSNGVSVANAYQQSHIDLLRIMDRFPAASRPDPAPIRSQLLTLVTN